MKRAKPRDIGPELVIGRALGVPWKVLEERYGLSRAWLYRLWRAARPSGMACPNCGFHILRE